MNICVDCKHCRITDGEILGGLSMAREEEIKQAVENNLDVSIYTPKDGELLKEAFYIGAKWVDNHPKSPWISVKDDLPCNNSYLTSSVCTDDVIVYECGKIYNSYMRIDVNNEWYWAKGKPQYWMPIPELPKE